MKWDGYIFLSLLFCPAVTLAELDPYCRQLGKEYGSGEREHIEIFKECREQVVNSSHLNARRMSLDGKIQTAAYGPILMVEKKKTGKFEYIAGPSSRVKNITAIAFHADSDEIVTLDGQAGQVQFYWSYLTGNVTPFRTLRHKLFQGAVDVAFSNRSKETFVLNPQKGVLAVVDQKFNSRGTKDERQLKFNRVFTGIKNSMNSMVLDDKKNQIIIHDSSAKELVFLDAENFAAVDKVSLNQAVLSIQLKGEEGVLYARTQDGREVKLLD